MNLDIAILRLLKHRPDYERFRSAFPDEVLAASTVGILKHFGSYFLQTGADKIELDPFFSFLRSRYPKWTDKDASEQRALLAPVEKDNPVGYRDSILQNALSSQLGLRAIRAVEEWQDGAEVDLAVSLQGYVDEFTKALNRKVKQPRVILDFDQMLADEQNQVGLHWRTEIIDNYLKPLRGGDFGIVAARPDRGKTTVMACEVSHMAPQLLTLHGTEKVRPLIWLNNEGPGSRIQKRIVQCALGMTMSEMVSVPGSVLQEKYVEAVGHPDIIQVYDIHGFSSQEVEELFRKLEPGLVVFDMIDNIRFVGGSINGGERTDQLLEAMYQWARECCVKYDFPGLAASQISDAGEGLRYPAQNMLKDSRTGKQGACDFIITVGQDPNLPGTRFLGTTKQKNKREGVPPTMTGEVRFDGDRGRLIPPVYVEE